MRYINKPSEPPRLSGSDFLKQIRMEFVAKGAEVDDAIWTKLVESVAAGVDPMKAADALLQSLSDRRTQGTKKGSFRAMLEETLEGKGTGGDPHMTILDSKLFVDTATIQALEAEGVKISHVGLGDFVVDGPLQVENMCPVRAKFVRTDATPRGRYLSRCGFIGRAYEAEIEPWHERPDFNYLRSSWELARLFEETLQVKLMETRQPPQRRSVVPVGPPSCLACGGVQITPFRSLLEDGLQVRDGWCDRCRQFTRSR